MAENNKAGVVKSISIFIGISKLEYCKDKVNIPPFYNERNIFAIKIIPIN